MELFISFTDSPGIPPSATAHELFRGFSYVAPILLDDNMSTSENHDPKDQSHSISHVSSMKCKTTTYYTWSSMSISTVVYVFEQVYMYINFDWYTVVIGVLMCHLWFMTFLQSMTRKVALWRLLTIILLSRIPVIYYLFIDEVKFDKVLNDNHDNLFFFFSASWCQDQIIQRWLWIEGGKECFTIKIDHKSASTLTYLL